jgi:hypothetical protein
MYRVEEGQYFAAVPTFDRFTDGFRDVLITAPDLETIQRRIDHEQRENYRLTGRKVY